LNFAHTKIRDMNGNQKPWTQITFSNENQSNEDHMDIESSNDSDEFMQEVNTKEHQDSFPQMVDEWVHSAKPFVLGMERDSKKNDSDSHYEQLQIDWESRKLKSWK